MPPFLIVAIGFVFGVTFSDDLRRLHEGLLRDAIRHALSTMDRAAQEACLSAAQFARQIAMVEGSHKRLAMQPPEFWQWYGLGILATFGLPKEVEAAQRLPEKADRMARAELSDADEAVRA